MGLVLAGSAASRRYLLLALNHEASPTTIARVATPAPSLERPSAVDERYGGYPAGLAPMAPARWRQRNCPWRHVFAPWYGYAVAGQCRGGMVHVTIGTTIPTWRA